MVKCKVLGSKCGYSIRVVVWFQHYKEVRFQHKVYCAVSAQGLMCGFSTWLKYERQCGFNTILGYGVSTLILCGINTREQAVSVLFGCTVIVQTVV